ncbi:acylphosphatase [Echinicola rosea]|uniref:Acylphosphatase n=1 Tax=Echinicola rosea TaxID=1807691 RepID=A0ABQ1UNW9_9BACT|nr:acylphosphatase [Echinicola rosea]GGF22952.1 hypothetical protein GCM10011339_08740 [Echinicola rosea]
MNKKYKIIGKVQGVFFRKSTQEKAQEIGIKGWVKNESDGSVLTVIQGSEGQVKLMEKWLEKGPPRAEVKEILLLNEGYDLRLEGFEIIH